jgi:GDPmannose 4,6-dehydratase
MNQTALITGITGQDGSYLAELLLSKGYEVHGVVRRMAFNDYQQRFDRISHILDKIHMHYGSVDDHERIWQIIAEIMPTEVYHLAAQSHVKISFEDEFGTLSTNIRGTHFLLSAIRHLKHGCKFYFAATSEMFGNSTHPPQDESTIYGPVSPYAIAKLTSFHLMQMYRKAYGIHACAGILFNHESPRRGQDFVTRKITMAVARIACGLQKELRLGNMDSVRDWGFAGDYVKAMWLILQHHKADDYVVGTGIGHTIKDFAKIAFDSVGLNWQKYVFIDENFFRPTDVHALIANSNKIRTVLEWKPAVSFEDLVRMMVQSDMELIKSLSVTKQK